MYINDQIILFEKYSLSGYHVSTSKSQILKL